MCVSCNLLIVHRRYTHTGMSMQTGAHARSHSYKGSSVTSKRINPEKVMVIIGVIARRIQINFLHYNWRGKESATTDDVELHYGKDPAFWEKKSGFCHFSYFLLLIFVSFVPIVWTCNNKSSPVHLLESSLWTTHLQIHVFMEPYIPSLYVTRLQQAIYKQL